MELNNYFNVKTPDPFPTFFPNMWIEEVMSDLFDISDEAKLLLNPDGTSKMGGSGNTLVSSLKKISEKYPNLEIILECLWDEKIVSSEKENQDFYFFRNGVEKKAPSKIVYVNPFTEVII